MSQPLEVLFLTACCVGLRGAPIPLSKYSYLTQPGLVALTGSLLVGLPATALAVAAGTLCADWAWQRKTPSAAVINAGREVVALVAAFGVYAALVAALGLAASGLRVELLLPLFAYAIAYFALSRILFYFSLILRAKLERSERMFILRYECISYGATVIVGGTIIGTVVAWPPEVWGIVGVLLAFLGLLFKGMLEEAISAEELNKIHAMEAVITSNISLDDSFARIEGLAHRLVDWGDFRIYRRHEGGLRLAYPGANRGGGLSAAAADTGGLRGAVGRAAGALGEVGGPVPASPRAIRGGVVPEQGGVPGGLEATETLAQVSRGVSEDGSEPARASSMASEVPNKNRQQIRDAI